ncbi:putative disease resistance protein At1g59780 [Salvia hispanica]|uniref:putative disease resistance protein At1g59780 n=1 Tax=Salvia hispanica TaxID=49212 RepID=UPI002008FF4D|nr:putative disease resistance protein At1g59780 [Salvia hispanica]
MTAYGAVNSLRNTLENITRCPRFSLVGGSKKTIDVVHKELKPWEEVLQRLDKTSPSKSRKKANALDGRIKEAFWRFEDSLESLLTQQILSNFESLPETIFIDLQSLQNDVDSLIHTLDDMKEEYIYEVENMAEDEPISSVIGFHGTNSKMIGLSDQFERVKSDLINTPDTWNHVHALYGTAGVGKTTLAMKIYEDPEIQSMYECRAWVTVGRVPQPNREISGGIRAQLYGVTQGDDGVYYLMRERLDGKNCLIVLDDVWENFRFYSIPIVRRGCSSILLTGRHRKMMQACENLDHWYEVRLLNEEDVSELCKEDVKLPTQDEKRKK